ncbi:MAG: Urocanase [Acidobacteriaceae bacterium]|nr:Urocanase [Acidobacteriaceae bacterium]
MTASIDPSETHQQRVLRTFTVLHHLQPSLPASGWGGQIILSLGLNPHGSALAFASNIAGAVCLAIEEDAATARAALRSGACDFVVNTLDEALRAMKNEIRKHLPLSVGLQGNRAQILAELLERGVAPQLVSDFLADPADAPAIQTLRSQGSLILDFNAAHSTGAALSPETALSSEAILQDILQRNQWHLETFPQPTQSALRTFETQALTVIPTSDTLRTQWLHAAPKILPRESPLQRALWLTPAEAQELKKATQSTTHV